MDAPFEFAARYRVRHDFAALRDRFVVGEELVYVRAAYSTYDDMHGYFFRSLPGGGWRSWDLDAPAGDNWREHFEEIAGPERLVVAAAAGDLEAVEARLPMLISHEAPLWTELACMRAAGNDHTAVLERLLPTLALERRAELLMFACREGSVAAVATVLAAGIGVDHRDSAGQTPLHHAAARGDRPLVELLRSHGADPLAANDSGTTPLSLARAWRHDAVLALLAAPDSHRCAGTWELVPELNLYDFGEPARSGRYQIAVAAGQVRFAIDWETSDGQPREIAFGGWLDGLRLPCEFPGITHLSFTAVDDNTLDSDTYDGERHLSHARRRVSDDGRLLAVVQQARTPEGCWAANFSVYRRI
ncbi:MAG: ankyrin repeat domain-containing protein [Myxococcales bacterium]|nr:ankyrin repeat domain-containing protein [Myxococcales bacterium]